MSNIIAACLAPPYPSLGITCKTFILVVILFIYNSKLNVRYMKKFKFLKLSKSKKLRYSHNYFKEKIYLVFLHGFMSDIEGKKPQTF